MNKILMLQPSKIKLYKSKHEKQIFKYLDDNIKGCLCGPGLGKGSFSLLIYFLV